MAGRFPEPETERFYSALLVVDGGDNLVGILTHSDFGLHPRYRRWRATCTA